jgi:hypothetical protein
MPRLLHTAPSARSLPVLLAAFVPAVVAALAAGPAAAEPRDRFVNVAMEDQFRSRRETGALRGDVIVLVYSERHGAEAALTLGRRLHLHFHPTAETAPASEWSRQPVTGLPGWPAGVRMPDVHVIPVACLPEVPKALQAVARARMRTDSPHVPVWLDFDDDLNRLFGTVAGEPNVAIIDTLGRVHGVQNGHFDELEFRELAVTVDRLRLASRPAVSTANLPANTAAPLRR